MKNNLSRLCAILVMAMLVISCTAPKAPQSPAAETPLGEGKVLKVGVESPLTGPSAGSGGQIKNAVEMAFEKINYKIGDYTIKLVWIDSQSNPEVASHAYENAVTKDNIQVGLLGWNSSVAEALMEVTARHKIPHFFSMGASEIINDKFHSNEAKYDYWNFKFWPSPSKLTANYVTAIEDVIAAGAWDTGKEKRAFIYGEDTDWGRGFGNSIKGQLKEAGWTIVGENYFPIDQTDFSELMKDIKNKDADLIAGTSTASASLAAFIKQADKSGIKSLIIADGMGWIGNWHELTGDSSNYVIDQIPGWTTDKANTFAKAYKAKWNEDASPSSAGLGYDAANFFIQVLQAAYDQYGELNKETIYKFAKESVQAGKFAFTGGIVMSEYKFTPDTVPDPIVGKDYYTFPIIQYMNGKSLVVWPEDWKTAGLKTKP
jgi:branched-chain amino acid transport system substrate-binding protein